MGAQKPAIEPVAEACEEALVTTGGCGNGEDMRVSTPGGVFQVRWDERGGATAMGQLSFFPSTSTPPVCLRTGSGAAHWAA